MTPHVTLLDVCRAVGYGTLLGVLTSCQGTVRDGDTDDAHFGGGGVGGSGSGGEQGALASVAIPARPLQRLTGAEFNNTVRDLLGDTSAPGNRLPSETAGDLGFLRATDTSDTTFSALVDSAEELAANATAPTRLNKLLPCSSSAMPGDTCAKTFISDFGRRAFRRPLTEAEKTEFFTLYQQVAQAP